MCGRYDLHSTRTEVARLFGVQTPVGDLVPRYNVAPGTQITTVRHSDGDEPVDIPFAWWGFKPPWAGEKAPSPINARAEKVAESRYFRSSFEKRRCLVPANGWYEWQATEAGKQPYYFTATNDNLLMFAGIWTPTGEGGDIAAAIITEPARGVARDVHPRMPLVLAPDSWSAWLDPELTDRERIKAAVDRLPEDELTSWPVSTRVNRPANDDASLIERVTG